MGRLAQMVPIGSRREPLSDVERLRAELAAARRQVDQLTATVRDQAKALAEITDECPPWAPSVAIIYWKWSEARRHEKGWRQIRNQIRWLIADLGSLPAPKLTPLVWDEFRARRRLHVTILGGPPCDATLNLELAYAKGMLNFAVDRGMIRHNPLARAKSVPTVSQRESWLGASDVEKLLAAADDVVDRRFRDGDDVRKRAPLLKAFILCCFDSMLRFNEARHLRLDRIGPDGSVELLASETKSKRRRFIHLTPRTLEAIRKIERRSGAIWVFEGPYGYPAANRYGQIGEAAMRYWFHQACEIAGVDDRATPKDKRVRIHDLRAGGATTADALGARPTAIQAALGHTSFKMTERYLRSSKAEGARAVADVMAKGVR